MKIDFYKKNILLVDDNSTNIILLNGLLEDDGYTSIFTASSAYKAYKILENNSIDIILLDVMMPEINGLEACEYIKSNSIYSHIPIIMVTADDSDETLKKSFKVGADDYLTKPINVINMKVRVENALMNTHKDTLILNQNRLLAINETVKMLAHQWRQPLANISSITMDINISNQFGNLTNEKLTQALGDIDSSIQSLSTTLDEFSEMSQLESKPTMNNINKTVSKSIDLLKNMLESNNITIEQNLSKQKDILHFQNELMKILISIYVNSLEAFTRTGKNVQKFIKISTKQTDKITSIIITDNAGGVEKSIINKIFEPYTSTKSSKNAVGLGLYNAFNILKEFMDANIKLASFGDITTVTIELPTKLIDIS